MNCQSQRPRAHVQKNVTQTLRLGPIRKRYTQFSGKIRRQDSLVLRSTWRMRGFERHGPIYGHCARSLQPVLEEHTSYLTANKCKPLYFLHVYCQILYSGQQETGKNLWKEPQHPLAPLPVQFVILKLNLNFSAQNTVDIFLPLYSENLNAISQPQRPFVMHRSRCGLKEVLALDFLYLSPWCL